MTDIVKNNLFVNMDWSRILCPTGFEGGKLLLSHNTEDEFLDYTITRKECACSGLPSCCMICDRE